jgi:acyl carrier protein
MIPSTFVLLDALPMTANGKIDRKELPPPGTDRSAIEPEYVAPRTALEQQLAQIWATVLGLENVGVRDNFFSLGGHSLLATQLISRVRETLNVEVPLRILFEAPTVESFADAMQADSTGRAVEPVVTPVRSRTDDQMLPRDLDQIPDETLDLWLQQMLADEEAP